MGSFSIWHWLIALILIGFPLIFILRKPPEGPNRFGGLPLSMGLGEAVSSFFRNYVNFSGRASRSEFWFSLLFVALASFVSGLFDPIGIVGGIVTLVTFLPTIAVTTRRLHDINRSGWHQLLSAFFPVGTIVMIIWYCKAAPDGPALEPADNVGAAPGV